MSADQPFTGEIYMFGGNFAPAGWMLCQGQLLPISQFDELFQLLGTTYGGDGQETFRLPDLRGRIPIHQGNGHVLGEFAGSETVTLTTNQIPQHTHSLGGSTAVSSVDTPTLTDVPGDSTLAGVRIYATPTSAAPMNAGAIGLAGGSQPHENRMPFLCVNFIIRVESGIFPTQD